MELWNRRNGKLSMEELYKQYQKCIANLISLTSYEDDSQNNIAQEERNTVAQIENEYLQVSTDLQRAKQAIRKQYRSIWESCSTKAGLRRPEDQRPAFTDKSWRECVRKQEQTAKVIQDWFAVKTQQAVAERQRQLQIEKERRAAIASSQAEAERKRKEEAAALEEAKAALFLEEMKRKFRR